MDGVVESHEHDAAERLADRIRLDFALTAAGNVGVWDADLVRGRIYADANFARIYDVDPAHAAAGQPLGRYFENIHPDDRPAARVMMDDLLAGRVAEFSHEHRICRPDGTIRWVLARGRLVHDAVGKAVRLPGLSLDITERRQFEARQAFLLDLVDRLRALQDPIAILDVAVARLGKHLDVNRAGYAEVWPDQETMQVLCGYADGVPRVNQCLPMDLLGPGNAKRVRQGLTVVHRDVMADPVNATDLFRQLGSRGMVSAPLMRDGMLRATLWVATTVPRDWDDAEVALVEEVAARLWDALERARAEQALRETNALLEQRIAAALEAHAHVEEALRQSQKMEAIGQLTGGIAHDFNNMLQGISGAVELMQRRIADGRSDEASRYVDIARAGIERAAALTHRLLAFSRRQALAPRQVNVQELVNGVVPMIRQAMGASIALELRLTEPCWCVECDPNQLENALLNLAINARDAMMPKGMPTGMPSGRPACGGTLIIETAQETLDAAALPEQTGALPGDFVRWTIRDTGHGMSPDVLAHAFEPFFTTKPAGLGTGLGLSQVYGFINQSKGMVRLESVVGQGTAVHLYLPRGEAGDAPDVAAAAPAIDQGVPRGATVLVVEDEADIRGFMTETLRDLGCQVTVAENGPAGLNALRKAIKDLDMLVADVGLPGGLNGRQLADAARALRPDLPILLITGYAGDAIAEGALPSSMWLLAKPFTQEVLVDRLTGILGRHPALVPD